MKPIKSRRSHFRFGRCLTALAVCLVAGLAATRAEAQGGTYETNAYVETIAGSGFIGHVDGQGVNTMFSYPEALTVDSQTNVYVWDSGNRAIRKVDATFNVSTVISNFYGGLLNLFATGNELIILGYSASDVRTIWWIAPSGATNKMRTVTVGNVPVSPSGLVQTTNGIFFTSDNRIYIFTNDVAAVFAGSGNGSSIDGQGIFCSFNGPLALAADAANNLYVGEPYGIRKVSPQAVVTTVLATSDLNALSANSTRVISWTTTFQVKKLANAITTTLGGTNFIGFRDGESAISLFFVPRGLGFGPDNKLYVSDTGNRRIRRIVFDSIPASQLAIELRPTLILSGPVGRTYRIESRDSVSEPWNTVENVTLTRSPQVWLDPRAQSRQRFYRTVELPW